MIKLNALLDNNVQIWVDKDEVVPGGGSSSDLPEVTTDDNGKILEVVNGQWDKADLPEPSDPLPEVTSDDDGKILTVVDGEWDKSDNIAEINRIATQLELTHPDLASYGAYQGGIDLRSVISHAGEEYTVEEIHSGIEEILNNSTQFENYYLMARWIVDVFSRYNYQPSESIVWLYDSELVEIFNLVETRPQLYTSIAKILLSIHTDSSDIYGPLYKVAQLSTNRLEMYTSMGSPSSTITSSTCFDDIYYSLRFGKLINISAGSPNRRHTYFLPLRTQDSGELRYVYMMYLHHEDNEMHIVVAESDASHGQNDSEFVPLSNQ